MKKTKDDDMKPEEALPTAACSAWLEALRDYIDCRLEEEFAWRVEGDDGHRPSTHTERKAREKAWDALASASSAVFAKATLELKDECPDSFERDLLDKGTDV